MAATRPPTDGDEPARHTAQGAVRDDTLTEVDHLADGEPDETPDADNEPVSAEDDSGLAAMIDDLTARLDNAESALAALVVESVTPDVDLLDTVRELDEPHGATAAPRYPAAPGESRLAVENVTAAVEPLNLRRLTAMWAQRLGVDAADAEFGVDSARVRVGTRTYVLPLNAFEPEPADGTPPQRSTIAADTPPLIADGAAWVQIDPDGDGHTVTVYDHDWTATTLGHYPTRVAAVAAAARYSGDGPWPVNTTDGRWRTVERVAAETVVWGNTDGQSATTIVGQVTAVDGTATLVNYDCTVGYTPDHGWRWTVAVSAPQPRHRDDGFDAAYRTATAIIAVADRFSAPPLDSGAALAPETLTTFAWDDPTGPCPVHDHGFAADETAAKTAAITAANALAAMAVAPPIATNPRPGLGSEAAAAFGAVPLDGDGSWGERFATLVDSWRDEAAGYDTSVLVDEHAVVEQRLTAGPTTVERFIVDAHRWWVLGNELACRDDATVDPPRWEATRWNDAAVAAVAATRGVTVERAEIVVAVAVSPTGARITRAAVGVVDGDTPRYFVVHEPQVFVTDNPDLVGVAAWWGSAIADGLLVRVISDGVWLTVPGRSEFVEYPAHHRDFENDSRLLGFGEALARSYGDGHPIGDLAAAHEPFTVDTARAAINLWGLDHAIETAPRLVADPDYPAVDADDIAAADPTEPSTPVRASVIGVVDRDDTTGLVTVSTVASAGDPWAPRWSQPVTVTELDGVVADGFADDLAAAYAAAIAGIDVDVHPTAPAEPAGTIRRVAPTAAGDTWPHGAVAIDDDATATLVRVADPDTTGGDVLFVPLTAHGRDAWEKYLDGPVADRDVAAQARNDRAAARLHLRELAADALADTRSTGSGPARDRVTNSGSGAAFCVAADNYLSRLGVAAGQAVLVHAVDDDSEHGVVYALADDRAVHPQRVKWQRFSDADPAAAVKVLVPEVTGNRAVAEKARAASAVADRVRRSRYDGAPVEIADNYLAKHGVKRGSVVTAVALDDRRAQVVVDGKTLTVAYSRFTNRVPVADGSGGWVMRSPRGGGGTTSSIIDEIGSVTLDAVAVGEWSHTGDGVSIPVGNGWVVTVAETSPGRYRVERLRNGLRRGVTAGVTGDVLPEVVWAAAAVDRPFGVADGDVELAGFDGAARAAVSAGAAVLAASGWVRVGDGANWLSPDGALRIVADRTARDGVDAAVVWSMLAETVSAFGGRAASTFPSAELALDAAHRAGSTSRHVSTNEWSDRDLADLAADPEVTVSAERSFDGTEFVVFASTPDRRVALALAAYPTAPEAETAWRQLRHRFASPQVADLVVAAVQRGWYRSTPIVLDAADIEPGHLFDGELVDGVVTVDGATTVTTAAGSTTVSGQVEVRVRWGDVAAPAPTVPRLFDADVLAYATVDELDVFEDVILGFTTGGVTPFELAMMAALRRVRAAREQAVAAVGGNVGGRVPSVDPLSGLPPAVGVRAIAETFTRGYVTPELGVEAFLASWPGGVVSLTVPSAADTGFVEVAVPSTMIPDGVSSFEVTEWPSEVFAVTYSTPTLAALRVLRSNPVRYNEAWLRSQLASLAPRSPDHVAVRRRLQELAAVPQDPSRFVPAELAGYAAPPFELLRQAAVVVDVSTGETAAGSVAMLREFDEAAVAALRSRSGAGSPEDDVASLDASMKESFDG